MNYTIENRSDLYLFERGSEVLSKIEEHEIALLKEAAGYLAGFFEKESERFLNKLFKRKFTEERNPDYWFSLPKEELMSVLINLYFENLDAGRAGQLHEEIIKVTKEYNIVARYLIAIKNPAVAILTLNEKEYKVIFR